jgi:hypothetical protein
MDSVKLKYIAMLAAEKQSTHSSIQINISNTRLFQLPMLTEKVLDFQDAFLCKMVILTLHSNHIKCFKTLALDI